MYKICKTPKAQSTQLKFQNVLFKIMKKKELKDVTVVALCEEVKTTRKTFYKYFDTVEDVLYSIIDKEVQECIVFLKDDNADMSQFFDFWRERKPLLDFLQKREMSLILIDRFYIQTFSKEKKAKEFNVEDMKYVGWIYALISVLLVWHHSGMHQPSEEMQELVKTMLRMNR